MKKEELLERLKIEKIERGVFYEGSFTVAMDIAITLARQLEEQKVKVRIKQTIDKRLYFWEFAEIKSLSSDQTFRDRQDCKFDINEVCSKLGLRAEIEEG